MKGLRVLPQFSREELAKRRYLLGPATILKSYVEDQPAPEFEFHVLRLDRDTPFAEKGEPLLGKPRQPRTWLLARCVTGALEKLVEKQTGSESVGVFLYVTRDNCMPCSKSIDVDRDLLEVCPSQLLLMAEERRGETNTVKTTNETGRTLTVEVDNSEWLDLGERVQVNSVIEVQLLVGDRSIVHHWSTQSPLREREHLGIDLSTSVPDLKLVQLKRDSNLYYFAGLARRVRSRRYFDPTWQTEMEHREVLLDCGLPLVFEENSKPDEPSVYVQKEGDFMIGLCFLFGSISFSGVRFRTPLIAKVRGFTKMDFVPVFVLLDVELMPSSMKPQIRVSYHSKEKESLTGVDLGGYVPPM